MDVLPEDLRIDVIRVVGDGACAVRVTQLPTGTTAGEEEGESIEANRILAMHRLTQALEGDSAGGDQST